MKSLRNPVLRLPVDPAARVRLAIRAGLALVVALALSFVVYKVFFAGRAAQVDKVEAIASREVAEGTAEAATRGMDIVVQVERQKTIIDHITVRNDNDIKQAADAGTQVPAVADALDRALCLRRAYRADPSCAPLPGDGGGERAPERDAGSR